MFYIFILQLFFSLATLTDTKAWQNIQLTFTFPNSNFTEWAWILTNMFALKTENGMGHTAFTPKLAQKNIHQLFQLSCSLESCYQLTFFENRNLAPWMPCENGWEHVTSNDEQSESDRLVGWLVVFLFSISTFVGYLMPNPLLCN